MWNTSMLDSRPKLSVLMITYNHEQYIEQAIRSVMMQETDFRYELVIGEDCSTDRTREVVVRLKEEFPDRIRLILHEQNIGMIPNMVATYNECHGEYIALLEGDDYWTHPKKLQIQVGYMDQNQECRLSFHAAQVIYENSLKTSRTSIEPPLGTVLTFENWLDYRSRFTTYIATSTIIFRSPNQQLPEWYYKLRFAGDWPLIIWLMLCGGDMRYINEKAPMSAYRKHTGGVTHVVSLHGSIQKTHALINDLFDHDLIISILEFNHHKLLYRRILKIHLSLVGEYLATGDIYQARKHLYQAIRYFPLSSRQQLRKTLKLTLRCYTPSIYHMMASLKHAGSTPQ